MARILFVSTKWGYPILATDSEAVKHDIAATSADMDELVASSNIMDVDLGLMMWEGQYEWGDEFGPDIVMHRVRPATHRDLTELGFAIPKETE